MSQNRPVNPKDWRHESPPIAGRTVRNLRNLNFRTQRRLAEELDCSVKLIQNAEKGHGSWDTLGQLARAFDCNYQELLMVETDAFLPPSLLLNRQAFVAGMLKDIALGRFNSGREDLLANIVDAYESVTESDAKDGLTVLCYLGFVKELLSDDGRSSLFKLVRFSRRQVKQAMEFRILIEEDFCKKSAKQPDEFRYLITDEMTSQINVMEEVAAAGSTSDVNCSDHEVEICIEADIRFHLAFTKGHPLLREVLQLLLTIVRTHIAPAVKADKQLLRNIIAQHKRIRDYVHGRQPKKAASELKAHLKESHEVMLPHADDG